MGKKCYGCVIDGKVGGEYWACSPSLAGRKIFRNLLRMLEKDEMVKINKIQFEIINLETKKTYKYVGYRMKDHKVLTFYDKARDKTAQFVREYKHVVRRVYDDPTQEGNE